MALAEISLNDIRENPVALRAVDTQSEAYLGLVDSVRANGVLSPIVVRECTDETTGQTFYGLIDGLHRFSASKDAGKDTIPVNIVSAPDAKVLELQIIGNLQKIETKPVEYSKQLQRILAGDPLLSIVQLAGRLNKSTAWLGERLGLLKLSDKVSALVDEGKVNLSNAYALAKLPAEEQENFLTSAQTMTPAEFAPTVFARKKELDKARREGKDAGPQEFVAVPHLQKVSAISAEISAPKVGPYIVAKLNLQTAEDGFIAGLRWASHMDPDSVDAAKRKDEQRKAETKKKNEEARAERAQKAAKALLEKAAANTAAATN